MFSSACCWLLSSVATKIKTGMLFFWVSGALQTANYLCSKFQYSGLKDLFHYSVSIACATTNYHNLSFSDFIPPDFKCSQAILCAITVAWEGMGRSPPGWVSVGWKVPYYGSSFKAIDVIIHCFEIVIVYSRTLTTLSSPSAIKLSSAQLKYKLQCGVLLMSSGAKYAPYVFDFKSVLKAHKLRPVHYSLFKLKKIRSGLADAVTYLTLFLFFSWKF